MASSDETALCINAIRCLAAELPTAASSGHPGAPIGCAPMAHAIFSKFLKYSPADPKWPARDRFVLSNGHASALQYTLLHLLGMLEMDDLKAFRQLGSSTPGHPENHVTPGIEVTTGPLGQGITNAVGMAIAAEHFAATFNKDDGEFSDLFDSTIYCICGDGCLQEGVSAEAASLAGHLKLGRLVLVYDDNKITIDGGTDLSFSEDVRARFESYGWHTLVVEDGNSDFDGIVDAIATAKAVTDAPSIICVRTEIGHGAGSKAGTSGVHGSPLKLEEIAALKEHFGLPADESFYVPHELASVYANVAAHGNTAAVTWRSRLDAYAHVYPEEAAEITRRFGGDLPDGWRDVLPTWTTEDKATATRSSSGQVLNALAEVVPEIMGGSADLTPSNKTQLKCSHDFQPDSYDGRYLRFGVREHAMVGICNGMSAFGGIIPFGATFLTFLGYAAGAFRLSALSHFGVISVFTHDSIGVGEDGPTHQPTSIPTFVRSLHNAMFIRPSDANEVAGAYAIALERRSTPSVLSLSRQNTPVLQGSSIDGVARGAYTLAVLGDKAVPDVVLVGTGTETALAMDAAKELSSAGDLTVAVVSFPCWSLFEEQDLEYRESVFPPFVPVLAVEAYDPTGWDRYSHAQVSLRGTYGLSAPAPQVYAELGITTEAVIARAKSLVAYYADAGYRPEPLMRRW